MSSIHSEKAQGANIYVIGNPLDPVHNRAGGRERTVKESRILTLLFTFVLLLPGGFSEDVTQWQLHETADPALIHLITFSPDGTRLAVASVAGVTLYDTYTGHVRTRFPLLTPQLTAVALSPDNTTLAKGDARGNVTLWNAHTGELIGNITAHAKPVVALTFSPDGNALASGSFKEVHLSDLRVGAMPRPSVLRGHRDMVTGLAFSPDSRTVASTSFYGTILVWDVARAELRHRLRADTSSVLSLLFSPDNRTLVSGGYWDADAGETLQMWHVDTGHRLATFENHSAPVFALGVGGSQQTLLASAGWDTAIRLWDMQTGELQAIFDTGTAPIAALACLHDADGGGTIASASFDGTVQLLPLTPALLRNPWDVNTDGVVNILDLATVTLRFGQRSPDFNGDGVVDILDVILVAQRIRK